MVSTEPISAVALLRAATREAHDRVDAAFGRFALDDREGYAAFLMAHARALPVAEARMAVLPFARSLPIRTPLLAADLAALGLALPDARHAPAGDVATAWGALYVVEGSRLGGAMLARQVPAQWPSAYLGAIHPPGGWRAIRAAIDDAAAREDARWRNALVAGAVDTFDLYFRAAG